MQLMEQETADRAVSCYEPRGSEWQAVTKHIRRQRGGWQAVTVHEEAICEMAIQRIGSPMHYHLFVRCSFSPLLSEPLDVSAQIQSVSYVSLRRYTRIPLPLHSFLCSTLCTSSFVPFFNLSCIVQAVMSHPLSDFLDVCERCLSLKQSARIPRLLSRLPQQPPPTHREINISKAARQVEAPVHCQIHLFDGTCIRSCQLERQQATKATKQAAEEATRPRKAAADGETAKKAAEGRAAP